MLGRVLHPLDRRQQTLLLTTLSFAGSSAGELWRHVPDHDQQAMQAIASRLEEIPKDKRIAVMIRELRQLMAFRSSRGLEGVEPSWLAHGFKGEPPRVIGIVLMHMPSSLSRQIVQRLPDAVRQSLPPREALKNVPLDVARVVRAHFDAKFAPMPHEREPAEISFHDLVLLTAKDLVTVARQVGADELACAFLAVGKRALAEFLAKLPPRDAEEVLAAVRRADVDDQMERKAAQEFVGKVLGNFHDTEELFQKAGLYRLARGVAGDSPDVVRPLAQRFPRAHGRLLLDYLERIAKDRDDDQRGRLRDMVLDGIADLSRRGKIDPRFGQCTLAYEARA